MITGDKVDINHVRYNSRLCGNITDPTCI